MQTYSDATSGFRFESEPQPYIPPAELMPAPIAAERVYERGSIAEMIQTMFREADEQAASGQFEAWVPDERREAEMKDPEAFREFLAVIQSKLKESDAVQHLQRATKEGREISSHDIEAVFRAYERALHETLNRLRSDLSPEQLHRLRSAAMSELDWSLRDMISQHVVASADADSELHFDPTDFFLLLNPKARKIDYMDSQEVLTTLRRSMSRASKDQLKRDLVIVHHHEAALAVQDLVNQPDFVTIEASIN